MVTYADWLRQRIRSGPFTLRQRQRKVHERACEQDQHIACVPERIEEVARRRQELLLGGVVFVESPGERKDDGEEDREFNPWK
jgi:hypothetical protein